jgi:uncharacterized OB-fold protein
MAVTPGHYETFLRRAGDEGYPLQRCLVCGHIPTFPRVCCPRCFGQLEWFAGCGEGTMRSCGIIQRTHAARYEPYLPIVMSHIALDEGVEVIGTVVGEARLRAAVGRRVRRAPPANSWSVVPQFELAD